MSTYSPLPENAFLAGNANAPEHEIFEAITTLMTHTSRIRNTYSTLGMIFPAYTIAQPDDSVLSAVRGMRGNIATAKMQFVRIMLSIPEAYQEELF